MQINQSVKQTLKGVEKVMFNNGLQPSHNEDGEKGFFVTEIQLEENIRKENERKEAYKKHLEKVHNRKQNKFTNTNMDEIDYICTNLTNTQIGFLMILQSYIDYDGKLIKSQKVKTSFKTCDFLKVLGLEDKRQTFYDFKDKCLEKGILIYKGEEKAYFINKKYIFKGAFKGMDVVSVVTNEMKEMSEELKPTDLAIIFKLQKYVHLISMAMVWNPDESDPSKLKTLKAQDLANELGVSRSYVYTKLPMIKYKNNFVIAQVKAGKKKSYMLNPKVFFRGDYTKVQENITHPNSVFFNAE